MIKIYGSKDYITMPWKNGLGFTSQMVIEPCTAQFPDDAFKWRLSSAPILSSGTFSRFAGYDRILMLSSGTGLKIGNKLFNLFDSLHFSGDEIFHAELTEGPVQDLGFIYDRKKIKAEMVVKKVGISVGTMNAHSGDPTLLIYCLEESIQVLNHGIKIGELARIENEANPISLRPHPKCRWVEIKITYLA